MHDSVAVETLLARERRSRRGHPASGDRLARGLCRGRPRDRHRRQLARTGGPGAPGPPAGGRLVHPLVTFGRAMPELDRTTERRLAAIVVAAADRVLPVALALAPTCQPDLRRREVRRDRPQRARRQWPGDGVRRDVPQAQPAVAGAGRPARATCRARSARLGAPSQRGVGGGDHADGSRLGWRIRPVYGAAGAIAVLALPYFFDIARTAGIDMPSIALTFLTCCSGSWPSGAARLGSGSWPGSCSPRRS